MVVSPGVKKDLQSAEKREQKMLNDAVEELGHDPRLGDIRPMQGMVGVFRKRVGQWRIFFRLEKKAGVVLVVGLERRTSHTY